MDVVSACPLRVASIVWQPRPGAFALTVVCKATFVLEPGTSPFTGVQDEPHGRDVRWDDDPRSSLRWATDLAPFKRRPEVLLVGHAYASGGQPVTSLVARLVVGEVDKAVAVHSDRWIAADGRISEPARFAKVPLRWERAAGGPGTSNPVGMPLDAAAPRGPVALPNLAPPHVQITSRRDVIPPVGFGPVAPTWPDRVEKLRQHAASWDHDRWSASPLPNGIDGAYFNAAPADQQLNEIRPDERIVLENLHPRHARLVTNLQALAPRAVAVTGSGPEQDLRLRCDTLSIDTDRGSASLVWRASLPLGHSQQAGRVIVSMNQAAAPAWILRMDAASADAAATMPLPSEGGASAAPLPTPVRAPAKLAGTAAIDPSVVRQGASLPFRSGPSSTVAAPVAMPSVVRPPAALAGTAAIDSAAVRQGPAVPFASGPSLLAVEPATMPKVVKASASISGTMAIDVSPMRRGAELPFGQSPGAQSPVPAAPPMPIAAHALQAPAPVELPDANPLDAPGSVRPASEAAPGLPAPPALIGPLAAVVAPAPADAPPPPPPAPEVAQTAPSPEPAPPAPAPLRLDAYPVGRCAAIAASVARTKPDRAATLEKHSLTEETWQEVENHWAEAMREESTRGKTGLLRAYDEAYVAQLEAERGVVTVEEYARLVVAAERGTEAEVLAGMGLPRGALLRVQRVWAKKMAADAALGRRVRSAAEVAREE